jgi:signal peptidase I
MMGDNRDNSADSREWGTVSEESIVGKAIAVWMHKEPGLNLPTFFENRLIN